MVKKEPIYDVVILKILSKWIGTPPQFFSKDFAKVQVTAHNSLRRARFFGRAFFALKITKKKKKKMYKFSVE